MNQVVVRKLEVPDADRLQTLVIDNLEAIESGLTLLDARLLLGQATVDVVALDAGGSLVLIALALTADEALLLKAVEAYSWCLEYPDAIRRLYPAAQVSDARPPRVMFVVDRMPDAFHRKIKQLGFADVDCVQFRHLAIDGAPVAYFESLARIRRPTLAPASEPPARPATPEPARGVAVENVIPMSAAPAARPTGVKLQRLLHHTEPAAPAAARVADRLTPPAAAATSVERSAPAPVARSTDTAAALAMVTPPVAAPRIESRPRETRAVEPTARISLREAAPLLEPVATPAVEPPPAMPVEPRISFAEAAKELLGLVNAPATPTATTDEPDVEDALAPAAVALESAPVAEAAPEPVASVAVPPAEETRGDTGVEPAAGASVARQLLSALPQEFQGLSFPNDGQLTRQWMEFLNQMTAAAK